MKMTMGTVTKIVFNITYSESKTIIMQVTEFKIVSSSNGFNVMHKFNPVIRITLHPSCLEAKRVIDIYPKKFGFYDTHKLTDWIVRTVITDNVQCPEIPLWHSDGTYFDIDSKLLREFRKELTEPIGIELKRLRRKINPKILQVQKILSNIRNEEKIRLELYEKFYENKYLIMDVMRYRACRIAVKHGRLFNSKNLKYIFEKDVRDNPDENLYLPGILTTEEIEERKAMIKEEKERNLELNDFISYAVDNLEDWMSLYSYDRSSYTSLNRTLMNLPLFIPSNMPVYLKYIKLEKPLTQRTEFLLSTLYAQTLENFDLINSNHTLWLNHKIFFNSNAGQILKALKLVSEHTHTNHDGRMESDLINMVYFLWDYPYEHKGNIVSLAGKAIKWHRDIEEGKAMEKIIDISKDRKTSLPPILLPDEKGITFLSSINKIILEGRNMNHCIAHYTEKAVDGLSYLFHVEYMGEMASVEISRNGKVRQSLGPGNCRNRASEWGNEILSKWGKGFKKINFKKSSEVTYYLNNPLFDNELPY